MRQPVASTAQASADAEPFVASYKDGKLIGADKLVSGRPKKSKKTVRFDDQMSEDEDEDDTDDEVSVNERLTDSCQHCCRKSKSINQILLFSKNRRTS